MTRGNELLFHSIAQAKIKQPTNGTITAQGLCGRPLTLLKVPSSEKSSHLAGRHTLQQRSQTVEKVTTLISSPENVSVDQSKAATIAQHTSLMSRRTATYIEAAKENGISFVEPLAALSAEMSLSSFTMLKRLFTSTFGYNPFGSLAAIREKRKSLSFD